MTKEERWNAWIAWERWHDHNSKIIALTTGISVRSVQRYRKSRNIPPAIAALAHQLMHGRAVTLAPWRTTEAVALRDARKRLSEAKAKA